ncbi:MAG: hypothetical protein FWF79_08995 [Defluviitaleaceae bacterium]|nr:hypothetical protein [Defluviitaleaceae bacterium]
MPDQVKKVIDPLKARWDVLTQPQRYKLLGVIAVALVALVLMVYFSFRTTWTVVVNNESMSAIGPMQNALDSAGIRNRLINRGTGLEVDERRSDEAIVVLNSTQHAVPNSEHFTWANAFDTGLGTTDSERSRREILATEGDIERHLAMQEGVISALVTLNVPMVRPFDRNAPMPSASVTVTTSRDFSPMEGRNLALIVARSVNRLEPDRVMIMDQFARPVWSGDLDSQSLADETQQIRDRHTNRVEATTRQLLSMSFDESTVTFNPRFEDRLMSEEIRTIYTVPDDMDGTGIVHTNRGQRAEAEGTPAGMEPGLQPQTATFPSYINPGSQIMSASSHEWARDYLVNVSTEVVQLGPGWVDPVLSTGAITAVRNFDIYQGHWMAEDESRTVSDWERFKNENAEAVVMNGEFTDFAYFHELVAASMGIPVSNVQLVITRLYNFIDTEATVWDIPTYLMVAVLILLLLMLAYGLLRKQRAAGEDEDSMEPQLAVEDLLVSTQLEEAKEDAVQELEEIDYFKENEIKKHIEKFVNEKPEAVAALLRNWINVEEW